MSRRPSKQQQQLLLGDARLRVPQARQVFERADPKDREAWHKATRKERERRWGKHRMTPALRQIADWISFAAWCGLEVVRHGRGNRLCVFNLVDTTWPRRGG
jgi:hypothetical protein